MIEFRKDLTLDELKEANAIMGDSLKYGILAVVMNIVAIIVIFARPDFMGLVFLPLGGIAMGYSARLRKRAHDMVAVQK